VLDHAWYEKTAMKQKEVEDVFGGKEEFKNADSMASEFPSFSLSFQQLLAQKLTFFVPAQCPAEGCNGERAYFFQLQIRSADEPMTTFLKVWSVDVSRKNSLLTMILVHHLRYSLERELNLTSTQKKKILFIFLEYRRA
jgi:DNA-directed RNA polymerase subunit M/transcription elongation factor TFIIS